MEKEKVKTYKNPMADEIFKSIFTMDTNHIIIRLLAKELLGFELETFETLSQGFTIRGKNEKKEETDFYCEVNGHSITIECNRENSPVLRNRNISHLRRMVVDGGFQKIQINFDAYDILGENKLVYDFAMREKNSGSNLYIDLLRVYHINLKYIEKIVEQGYNEIRKFSIFERMCMIFMTKNDKELEEVVKGSIDLEEIRKVIDKINGDDRDDAYLYYTKHELELAAAAERNKKEGKEQGIKEEQIEIAKKMIKDNLDIETISKYTGLTKEELEKLSK